MLVMENNTGQALPKFVKKPDSFKRILSRQPDNLLSVRLRKTGFDAFKVSNIGSGKRRTEFSPD